MGTLNMRKSWSRDELILTMELYCRTPFGRLHSRNKDIIVLANAIGRTPSAVALKMTNFASLDPTLHQAGMANASKLDQEIWNEFFPHWEEIKTAAEKVARKYPLPIVEEEVPLEILSINKTGEDILRLQKTRKNQSYFRQVILASYNSTCAVTGIKTPELLVASHIVPWSQNEKERMNFSNGICLNALHDKAFDKGLLTFDDSLRVIISSKLQCVSADTHYSMFKQYEGKQMILPSRFRPLTEFVAYHRQKIFMQ